MKYFAYGANLNQKTFKSRCPDASFISTATLSDFEFFITSRGYSSLRENKDSFVQGVIWEITESDESLLDIYEGVDAGYYSKEFFFIEKYGLCLVYVASEETEGSPNEKYLKDIILQSKSYGFDEEYIEILKSKISF